MSIVPRNNLGVKSQKSIDNLGLACDDGDMNGYRTYQSEFAWSNTGLQRLLGQVLTLPGVKVSVRKWADSLGQGWRVMWSVPGVPAQRAFHDILPCDEWEKMKNWIESIK